MTETVETLVKRARSEAKGIGSTAARELIEELCQALEGDGLGDAPEYSLGRKGEQLVIYVDGREVLRCTPPRTAELLRLFYTPGGARVDPL